MRIHEFMDKYCQDLIEKSRERSKLVDLETLPHDGIEYDIEGNAVPVVYVDNMTIPVHDFVTEDRSDFIKLHVTPSAGEAFDNYISALEIIEGVDVINKLRKAMEAEKENIDAAIDNYESMI